jgi:hypothetical protein
LAYQPCRWYDVYPGLAFVLKLVRLMPYERQTLIGERLNQYLSHRMTNTPQEQASVPRGNRWYDEVEPLFDSLERLKSAPHAVKQQSTDFLLTVLEESGSTHRCA